MSFIDSPFVDVHVCWQPRFPRSCRSTGQRLPALLFLTLLLLGLAGCGGDGSHGYADRPPTNRTALVAWQEWTRFGRSTVVYGGAANGYTNRAGMNEHSEPLNSRVGDYWGSCGHPEWNGRTSGRPWSGAFVSWVMTRSGVSPQRFRARRPPRPVSHVPLRPRASRPRRELRAARTQRICSQGGRSGLHRHGRPDLALRRFAHRAAADRQYGEPLRRRHRRARRLRPGGRRQREEQRDHEPLSGRFARPAGRPASSG